MLNSSPDKHGWMCGARKERESARTHTSEREKAGAGGGRPEVMLASSCHSSRCVSNRNACVCACVCVCAPTPTYTPTQEKRGTVRREGGWVRGTLFVQRPLVAPPNTYTSLPATATAKPYLRIFSKETYYRGTRHKGNTSLPANATSKVYLRCNLLPPPASSPPPPPCSQGERSILNPKP